MDEKHLDERTTKPPGWMKSMWMKRTTKPPGWMKRRWMKRRERHNQTTWMNEKKMKETHKEVQPNHLDE
jgi:hypothetical protein